MRGFLRERWEIVALCVLAVAPLVVPALGGALGGQITTLFIYCILALGLNVMVGYTGLVHLGIAAFFGIGAYLMAILTVPMYPFQIGWFAAAIVSVLVTAGIGLALGGPTLRLRGDYLAVVTLGFGEVVKVTLRNLEQITGGMKGLNPVPPPGAGVKVAGIDLGLAFAIDPRWFYYLSLLALAGVVLAMRRLENSRLGRAWVAVREDELAASAMGISATKVKLSAFAMSSAVAGLAGCLYAGSLSTTADPNAYDFNRSIMVLCAVILGGLGSIPGHAPRRGNPRWLRHGARAMGRFVDSADEHQSDRLEFAELQRLAAGDLRARARARDALPARGPRAIAAAGGRTP